MKKLLICIMVFTVIIAFGVITDSAYAGKNGNGNGYPEGDHFNLNLIAKKSDPALSGYFNCPDWDYYMHNIGICTPELIGTEACIECNLEPKSLCPVKVPPVENVVFVPRYNDNTPDKDITIRIKSGSDRPGKGNKIKDTYPSLAVTDWCTEHFPDFGEAQGDEAEVMLPENANGYGVYSRITGRPLEGTAWTFMTPSIEQVQDEYGNDLLYLGNIDHKGNCTDADGNPVEQIDLDRIDNEKGNGKGKGVKEATDLTCLFEFTGKVCYVNDLCYYCEGDSCNDVFDANDAGFVCCENHVDGDGLLIKDDCGEPANFACIDPDCDSFDASEVCIGSWICPEGTNIVDPMCRDYQEPTWIFNIADFVDVLWKSETNGAYVIKLRFYPL
jgi:hypothetical protein